MSNAPKGSGGSSVASETRKKKDPAEGFVPKQADYIREATKKNVWYYRDRLNVARGPCTLPVLRKAWVNGIIDQHTLVWGHGLIDWLPVRNIRTLVPQVRTFEVQVATFINKNLYLKPALELARKQRSAHRTGDKSSQADDMF